MEINKNMTCRICGFLYDDYYPWGENGNTPDYEMCACCGGEFGFDDDIHACGKPIQEYRSKWIDEGANFYNPSKRPENWNLEVQLGNIPEEFV